MPQESVLKLKRTLTIHPDYAAASDPVRFATMPGWTGRSDVQLPVPR